MACFTADAASGQHVTLFIDPVRSSVTKYHVFVMAHGYGTLLVTCVGRALISKLTGRTETHDDSLGFVLNSCQPQAA